MVLQRNTEVNLWGGAEAGKTVTVETSWNGAKYKVKADDNGQWKVKVETGEAGGPYTITFSDGDRLTLDNILLGEVWICGGQSNMARSDSAIETAAITEEHTVQRQIFSDSRCRRSPCSRLQRNADTHTCQPPETCLHQLDYG